MIGQSLGHFRVLAEIGAGGMGVVYRARDEQLDRDVALKVLPAASFNDQAARVRLVREARLASRLNHPHICTVYEAGESDDQAFIAMELVEGRPLSDVLSAGPLPLPEVFRHGVQLADALAHAHERQVVHRDLKSANIVITPDGRAKVLDFGLATRQRGEDVALEVTRTQDSLSAPGTIAGTLAYMAPEQLRGQPADARSDIWALGVVLYEMASGARPFRGQTSYELSSAILNQPPEPLRATTSGAPPAQLQSVVDRCLQKDPARRYQSAAEVKAALEALQSAPVAAVRWFTPLTGPRRRFSLAASAVAALALLLVVLDVGGLRRLFRGSSQAKVVRMAVLPFANLTGDPTQEYLSDGLTQELISQLGSLQSQKLTVIARSSVERYKAGGTPVDQIARDLGVDYVLEGSARREANRVRVTAELVDAREQTQIWADTYEREPAGLLALQAEVAGEVARRVRVALTTDRQERLTRARQVRPEVYEAYLRGMFFVSQNTPESFERGMRHLHQAIELDPAEPLAYAGLAQGYITLGHGGAEQPDAFPRARAVAEQALTLEPDMAEAVGALAHVALYYEWDWAKAEQLFKRTLELNPSLAMTHYHYAWYLALFDRLDEAIVEHELARDLDPLRALHTGWLGQLYNYGGRYEDAVVAANKALELNPSFAPSYQILSLAYSRRGMHEQAIAAAQRHAEVDPVGGRASLCASYALAGRRAEALVVASGLQRGSPRFPRVASAYLALGNRDEALRELEDAYRAHRPTVPWIRVRGGFFDALRDAPRFQDLLRRMNLPA